MKFGKVQKRSRSTFTLNYHQTARYRQHYSNVHFLHFYNSLQRCCSYAQTLTKNAKISNSTVSHSHSYSELSSEDQSMLSLSWPKLIRSRIPSIFTSLNFMKFTLFTIKFIKFKPKIKFIKFERHNYGLPQAWIRGHFPPRKGIKGERLYCSLRSSCIGF